MIVKTHGHYHDGFVWIDNVEKVQDYGFLLDDLGPATFATLTELSEAIAAMWGDDRSYADELWPRWPGADGPNGKPGPTTSPISARTICVKRRDGEHVLIIAANANPVYLLSDSGDTVDRL